MEEKVAVRPPGYSKVTYTWSFTSRTPSFQREPPTPITAVGGPAEQFAMLTWWLASSASRPFER
jgi:hypothetical protein